MSSRRAEESDSVFCLFLFGSVVFVRVNENNSRNEIGKELDRLKETRGGERLSDRVEERVTKKGKERN